MGSQEGIELAKIIRKKVAEMSDLCLGVDEALASGPRKPLVSEGSNFTCERREGEGFMPAIEAFLKQETPLLELEAANPFSR